MTVNITEPLNVLPRLTYRWLRLNHHQLQEKLKLPLKPYGREFLAANDQKVILKNTVALDDYPLAPLSFGVSAELVAAGEKHANSGIHLQIPPGEEIEEPIRLRYDLSGEDDTVFDHNIIMAGAGSTSTVIIEYYGGEGGYHNGVTKIFAEEGAEVTLIKIQSLADQALHFDSHFVDLGPYATVNYIQIELGSKSSLTNYVGRLAENSTANVDTVYLGDGRRVLDLSYQMIHEGYRSHSDIEVRGALRDHSKKTFRGTLDFKRGAKKAFGREAEYALLLDPTVKADAVPLLLAAEDDIEGEHAASAGKVDQDQLFYLMSRGFSEEQALKTVVEANLNPVLEKLPKDLQVKARQEIERRLLLKPSFPNGTL